VTPLSDGAAGPVTLPAGSATAKPLDNSSLGTAAVQPLMSTDTKARPQEQLLRLPRILASRRLLGCLYVQAGDTLSTLATAHAITVAQLTTSNCLTNADVIDVGQVIYVPGAGASGGSFDYGDALITCGLLCR